MSIALKIPFLVPRLGIALSFLLMTIYTGLHLYLLIKEGLSSLADDETPPLIKMEPPLPTRSEPRSAHHLS